MSSLAKADRDVGLDGTAHGSAVAIGGVNGKIFFRVLRTAWLRTTELLCIFLTAYAQHAAKTHFLTTSSV